MHMVASLGGALQYTSLHIARLEEESLSSSICTAAVRFGSGGQEWWIGVLEQYMHAKAIQDSRYTRYP